MSPESDIEEYHKKILERISMLNDGVYAIVLTLLVLELHIPDLANQSSLKDLAHALQEMSPKFLAFLLSVLLVGGSWISSINLQRVVIKTNDLCVVLSVIYLIIISLFPFSCVVIGNFPSNPGSYLIFGILSILMTVNAYIWMHSIYKNQLLHRHADYPAWKKLMKMMPLVVVFLIGVSLSAFINTTLSFILFLITNLFPFFLTRSVTINHKDEVI